MESVTGSLTGLLEIIFANAILSGDNAVVIGLAAAGLPAAQRSKAVLFGVVAAAVLRIIFSIFASFLLTLWWIELVGGLALLYIAWGFWRELRQADAEEAAEGHAHHDKSLMAALWQIVVADVSMSLDNVLAIAAIARNNFPLLVIGLLVSIVMMGLLGGLLAKLLDRYRWIAYLGLALIVWIGLQLLWEGMVAGNDVLQLGLPLPAPHHEAAH
ncbi:YjbE family putative metal transport protein [Roseomonas sp. OT10]|uniref:YjbE family putative metal transport protein n=1 Tax=Roseomonas cutis TaxID=2897332 RepID=UPI001E343479|nr:YjbE family putative metal transport protein [Roseomonas sp. OT10]UFN50668.1 YjbE family putative metal transport protein [Roseomonas sp. OT10]